MGLVDQWHCRRCTGHAARPAAGCLPVCHYQDTEFLSSMDVANASWLVIVAALAAANLPFFNEYVFGFIPMKPTQPGIAHNKPFWVRLLELIVLYFLIG